MAAERPPQKEFKLLGIQKYTQSRRPDLVLAIQLPHRQKDDEIRRLCRQEFNLLSVADRWKWVHSQEVTFVAKGAGGLFVRGTTPTVIVCGARVQFRGLVSGQHMNGVLGIHLAGLGLGCGWG